MKNVWILERFVPAEETMAHIAEIEQMEVDTEELQKTKEMIIECNREVLKKNPNGHWCGYVGKSNYKAFCENAKDFMRMHKNGLLKSGIRVVKAQIEDDAKYWTGYKNAVVNDGVTKYLYATYR